MPDSYLTLQELLLVVARLPDAAKVTPLQSITVAGSGGRPLTFNRRLVLEFGALRECWAYNDIIVKGL
jgi:hypothetical protein